MHDEDDGFSDNSNSPQNTNMMLELESVVVVAVEVLLPAA